jgi:hypothetical protein
MLERLNCNPVEGLALIAMGKTTQTMILRGPGGEVTELDDRPADLKTRAWCYRELLKLVAPDYKDTAAAQAVAAPDQTQVNVTISFDERLREYELIQAKRAKTIDQEG